MALGRDNKLLGQITTNAQITGSGSAANHGNHFVLPWRARLESVWGSIEAAASGTTITVSLKAAGSAIASISLATATTKAEGTITDSGAIYAAGTEFEITVDATNTKTVDDLCVDLGFRSFEG
jgi:hypothetical protein